MKQKILNLIGKHKLKTQAITFAINDIKLYVPVVTLSTNDNTKLLKELKFKRTINWNKYQSKATIQTQII